MNFIKKGYIEFKDLKQEDNFSYFGVFASVWGIIISSIMICVNTSWVSDLIQIHLKVPYSDFLWLGIFSSLVIVFLGVKIFRLSFRVISSLENLGLYGGYLIFYVYYTKYLKKSLRKYKKDTVKKIKALEDELVSLENDSNIEHITKIQGRIDISNEVKILQARLTYFENTCKIMQDNMYDIFQRYAKDSVMNPEELVWFIRSKKKSWRK